MTKIPSVSITLLADPLKRCTLDTYRAALVVLTLYFVVEGQLHPLVIVTVTANTAMANFPPLLPTACRQQVARHVVPPASEGRPIMNEVELANFAMLLYELKPPPLLAILPQRCLVLIDVQGYILSVGILPCLLLWNRVLLAVAALECLALPVRHSMRCPSRAGALHDSEQWLGMPPNCSPPPCHLLGTCLCCTALGIDRKFVMHYPALGLQQTANDADCVGRQTLCIHTSACMNP